MDAVDVKDMTEFLGGGWLSIVIAALAIVILGYLKAAERKAKRDTAEKNTDLGRQREQAKTADKNQDLQDSWDDAADEVSRIRKEHKGDQ